jgi:hypothetical protein
MHLKGKKSRPKKCSSGEDVLNKNLTETMLDEQIDVDESEYNIDVLKEKPIDTIIDGGLLALQKYNFIQNFGITDTSNVTEFDEFTREFYNKTNTLIRFEKFFGFIAKERRDRAEIKIIIDLVNRLLRENNKYYNMDDLIDITIDNDQYLEAIDDIMNNSVYFNNEEENRPLFFIHKNKSAENNSQQHYTRIIQNILATYGINFGIKKRVRQGKKLIYDYILSLDKQIRNIIQFKHGLKNKVKGYPTIFKRIEDSDT